MLASLRFLRTACLTLAIGMLFSACATTPGAKRNPVLPQLGSTASLRPGDSLIITIQGVPDPSSNNVQIDDKNQITLPYAGVISTEGTTTATLSQLIRETYISKKIYTKVDVSVAVTERYVYVGGEVIRPGRIIWTPDLTLTKAIQAAGGFTLYAKETRISLIRSQQAYEISAALAQKFPAEDPQLFPGDSLQVPKSAF